MIPYATAVRVVPNPTPEQQLTTEEMASIVRALSSSSDGRDITWTEKEAAEGRVIGSFEYDRCQLIRDVLELYGYRTTLSSSGFGDGRQVIRAFLPDNAPRVK